MLLPERLQSKAGGFFVNFFCVRPRAPVAYGVAKRFAGLYSAFSRPQIPAERGAGAMAEYKVKFEVFEGPLDLLLYLIKKEEVDIYEVNLTQLAAQFIEYIEMMRLLDLEIAGEFLVMAATLMFIKSRGIAAAGTAGANGGGRGGGRPALGIDPPIGGI